jgi:hypothetical protein
MALLLLRKPLELAPRRVRLRLVRRGHHDHHAHDTLRKSINRLQLKNSSRSTRKKRRQKNRFGEVFSGRPGTFSVDFCSSCASWIESVVRKTRPTIVARLTRKGRGGKCHRRSRRATRRGQPPTQRRRIAERKLTARSTVSSGQAFDDLHRWSSRRAASACDSFDAVTTTTTRMIYSENRLSTPRKGKKLAK